MILRKDKLFTLYSRRSWQPVIARNLKDAKIIYKQRYYRSFPIKVSERIWVLEPGSYSIFRGKYNRQGKLIGSYIAMEGRKIKYRQLEKYSRQRTH